MRIILVCTLFLFQKVLGQDASSRSLTIEIGKRFMKSKSILDEKGKYGARGATGIEGFGNSYASTSGSFEMTSLKETEYFIEADYNIHRLQLQCYLSAISFSGNGLAQYGIYNNYTTMPNGIVSNYKTIKATLGISEVFMNIKFGIGFNLIEPSKKFQIIPFINFGGEKLLSSNINNNEFVHRHVYVTNPPIPETPINIDSSYTTNDANSFVLMNQNYKDVFATLGVKFGILFYKKIGFNISAGWQMKGKSRVQYDNNYIFRYGVYLQSSLVYQINFKAKPKRVFQ